MALLPNSALRLARSVAILALPAEAQVEWLRSLGLGEPGIVDELALEFDEGWSAIESFRAENWIAGRAMESLRKIDTLLDSSSGASGHGWPKTFRRRQNGSGRAA